MDLSIFQNRIRELKKTKQDLFKYYMNTPLERQLEWVNGLLITNIQLLELLDDENPNRPKTASQVKTENKF